MEAAAKPSVTTTTLLYPCLHVLQQKTQQGQNLEEFFLIFSLLTMDGVVIEGGGWPIKTSDH